MLHPLVFCPFNFPYDFELMASLRLKELEEYFGRMVRERVKRYVFVEERLENLVEYLFDSNGREVVGYVRRTDYRFYYVREGLDAV